VLGIYSNRLLKKKRRLRQIARFCVGDADLLAEERVVGFRFEAVQQV